MVLEKAVKQYISEVIYNFNETGSIVISSKSGMVEIGQGFKIPVEEVNKLLIKEL